MNGTLGVVERFDEYKRPIVRFELVGGKTTLMTVQEVKWDVQIPEKGVVRTRIQIPLILAYAM